MTVLSILKRPGAWVPIAIPLAFFLYVMTVVTFIGVSHSQDEGVGAHLFQLWLVSEPFLLGSFAVTWLPRAPRQALIILALQVLAALAGCFPVFYFRL